MGVDFDWKHNVTAHSAGPNLVVGREVPRAKKNVSWAAAPGLFLPSNGVKATFCLPFSRLWDGSPFLLRYTCIALEPGLVLEHSSSVDCSKLSAVQQLGSGERSESLM